jgi:Na+-driven multidrug efflux pump
MGIGDKVRAKEQMKDLTILAMISQGVLCGALILFADPYLSLYQPGPDVYPLARIFIILTGIATPLFWPASFILPGGLRSAGDARYCMVVSISTMCVMRIGVGYVLSVAMGYGVMGVWIAMFLDWVARGGIYVVRVWRDKWGNRKVIYDS